MLFWRKREPQSPRDHAQRGPILLATERHLLAAYQMVLGREPDGEGWAHYRERVRQGLRLDDLLTEFVNSTEYIEREQREQAVRTSPPAGSEPDVIDPSDVMRRYSPAQLAETADEYYRRVTDPIPLMRKPFAFLHETPEMLQNLGSLFAGLELGKSMTVLDFGAGTCWLSRILIQLDCRAISCDVSQAALDIGRRLFAGYPVIGKPLFGPEFLWFDGHRIDLPDASVDRIVCFDAFHHIPNPDQIIREFGRILTPGGIAGFSEPGPHHSRSPQAQYEMRHHRVLENDIVLGEIALWGEPAGFTHLTSRLHVDKEIPLDEYDALVQHTSKVARTAAVTDAVRETMRSRSVFFLHKGPLRRDSRSHVGLAHKLSMTPSEVVLSGEQPLELRARLTNTGQAHWLNTNFAIHGIVRLAAHLYGENDELLEIDYFRHDLPAPVAPGETSEFDVEVPVPALAKCRLEFDLVAEGVMWFENVGSRTVPVHLRRC